MSRSFARYKTFGVLTGVWMPEDGKPGVDVHIIDGGLRLEAAKLMGETIQVILRIGMSKPDQVLLRRSLNTRWGEEHDLPFIKQYMEFVHGKDSHNVGHIVKFLPLSEYELKRLPGVMDFVWDRFEKDADANQTSLF